MTTKIASNISSNGLTSASLLAAVFATLAFSGSASAHDHDGYANEAYLNYTAPDWMRSLPDNARLSHLSLPGTHDSGAHAVGGEIVETQSMDYHVQLESGIRAWDIRLNGTPLSVYHGPIYQQRSFAQVLATARSFLEAHPSETIVMRIKEEGSYGGDFNQAVRNELNNVAGALYTGSSHNPTLGEMRGKIVVLYHAGNNFQAGIPYDTLNVQDDYNLGSNWDLYSKWQKVRTQFDNATGGDENTIYVNYLSGSGGSFPYFVASGHSNWATGAPRLATGLTCITGGNTYQDFPRVDYAYNPFVCAPFEACDCTIAFEGTNILATNHLRAGEWDRAGIVFADFPGSGLIDEVIKLNYNFAANIQAKANESFVCADNGGASALIANRSGAGLWETFDVVDAGGGFVALRSRANGKFVAAEDAGNSCLIANRDSVGAWEKFQFEYVGGGYHALRAQVNGKYVAAENAGSSCLIANRDAVGAWESFRLNRSN